MAKSTGRYFQFPIGLLQLPDNEIAQHAVSWCLVHSGAKPLAKAEKGRKPLTLNELKAKAKEAGRQLDIPGDYQNENKYHRSAAAAVALLGMNVNLGGCHNLERRARQGEALIAEYLKATGVRTT